MGLVAGGTGREEQGWDGSGAPSTSTGPSRGWSIKGPGMPSLLASRKVASLETNLRPSAARCCWGLRPQGSIRKIDQLWAGCPPLPINMWSGTVTSLLWPEAFGVKRVNVQLKRYQWMGRPTHSTPVIPASRRCCGHSCLRLWGCSWGYDRCGPCPPGCPNLVGGEASGQTWLNGVLGAWKPRAEGPDP